MPDALSEAQITEQLASLPQWRFSDGAIRRIWKMCDWKATLMAVNAVGYLAELAWHHPEIVANYGSLEVRLNTHDAKGVTEKDFALATKINELLDWRPQNDTAH